jgi:protein TonB
MKITEMAIRIHMPARQRRKIILTAAMAVRIRALCRRIPRYTPFFSWVSLALCGGLCSVAVTVGVVCSSPLSRQESLEAYTVNLHTPTPHSGVTVPDAVLDEIPGAAQSVDAAEAEAHVPDAPVPPVAAAVAPATPARPAMPAPGPLPGRPAVPALATRASTVSASPVPRPLTAPPPTPAAAPPPSQPAATVGADAAASNYWHSVRSSIVASLRYPPPARRRGIEGRVIVKLVIDGQGRLVQAVPISEAETLLKQAALTAIRTAAPFPPPPTAMEPTVSTLIPIRFEIR